MMNRSKMIDNLNSLWDVIVIGGGASGLGIGLEAASRGYRTIVLEQGDFAQGTSSRSTKLIHGGIRYLRQGRISLVHEALQERAFLVKNAPHLVHPLRFLLPSYSWLSRYYYLSGIKLYDVLAGKLGLGDSHMLSTEEVMKIIPTIDSKHLQGGVSYFDGQFDDARLAVNLAQTIVEQGGTVINYMPVQRLLKVKDRAIGVAALDLEANKEYEVFGKVIINATGVYVDSIRRMDQPDIQDCVVPSQGAHIVLDRSFLPSDSAMIVPKTDDGRVLFAIPWHNRILVGTTDTLVEHISLEPKPLQEEIDYLLEYMGRYLTKKPTQEDILSRFAGIRPLVKPKGHWKNTSSLLRDYVVTVSTSQLVTVTGGKWTTYRKIGESTVEEASKVGGLAPRPSLAKGLRIHGWSMPSSQHSDWEFYGSDLPLVEALAKDNPRLLQKLHEDLPCRGVDVIWAVRHEMARSVEDVLSRRTRSLLLGARATLEIAPQVAALMAKEMGKDAAWEKNQLEAFQNVARGYQNSGY